MQNKKTLIEMLAAARPEATMLELNAWASALCQLEGCHVHSLAAQDTDDAGWHAARTKGIGGSEIAAICGKSSWSSPTDIYMKKIPQFESESQQAPQSEAARWGNVLEDVIIKEWAHRTNRIYLHIPVSLQSDENPIFIANVDGFELDEDGNVIGLIECKTTTLHNINAWSEGEVPIYYIYQIQWYMMITGLKSTVIMCLVGGQKLFNYDFPAMPSIMSEEKEAAINFWNNCVIPQIPPALTDVDTDRLQAEKAEQTMSAPPIITEDEDSIGLLEEYLEAREKESECKKIKKALQAKIYDLLGSSNEMLAGERHVKCTTTTRRTCNMDMLESKYPEVFKEVVSYNTSVTMRIK